MRSNPTSVLLVDDEDPVREMLRKLFERSQFAVTEAKNGWEGFTAAREDQPDVIVCDWMMPVMDGFEMLRLLRRLPKTQRIPIVMTTGLSESECTECLGGEENVRLLFKPFLMSDLLRTVRSFTAVPTPQN